MNIFELSTHDSEVSAHELWPWRPVFWEPVKGTEERIMVGVVYHFKGNFSAVRTIEDKVLRCMYGSSGPGLCKLIDHGIELYQVAAKALDGLDHLEHPLGGFFPGPLRKTEAEDEIQLRNTACMLYSSLSVLKETCLTASSIDTYDEEPSRPLDTQEFSTAVARIVALREPNFAQCFNKSARIVQGGQPVTFGFISPRLVAHFTVMNPKHGDKSVSTTRAKIYELQRARELNHFSRTALIASIPVRDGNQTGHRAAEKFRLQCLDLEREIRDLDIAWTPSQTPSQAAEKLLDLATTA